MEKVIITVQHTQSEHHVNGMIGAWGDWELTELGRDQSIEIGKALAKEIGDEKFVMYTSDLKRAYQTAIGLNKSLHIEPVKTELLREVNAGDGNGIPADWYNLYKKPYPEKYDPDYKPFENGESNRELWNRLYPFYRAILKSKDERIILVSHGTTLSFIQSMIIGNSFESLAHCRFKGKAGSVSKFTICSDGKTVVNYINRDYTTTKESKE